MNYLRTHFVKPVAIMFASLLVSGVTGCDQGEPIAAANDDRIPTITIVAKRMTEAEKRAHDAQMRPAQAELVQR